MASNFFFQNVFNLAFLVFDKISLEKFPSRADLKKKMNTGPTPLSERDPYPFPQPEGDLQFRGKDDSKNYKDPHKIISRKEVIFQKSDSIFDKISKKKCFRKQK